MRTRPLFVLAAALVALALKPVALTAAEPLLKAGDRVAIVGDSITEQKLYSKYIECYLLASSGVPDVRVMQFGWSGERADGFANRLENDLAGFHPTVVTLCYGMNDGSYQPFNEQIGSTYEANMRRILTGLSKFGVRTIVVGSPGAVDNHFFRPGQKMGDLPAHAAYNDNLAHLRDIGRQLAIETKQPFANVHDAMFETMKKAQEALGSGYNVCGGDGFHPGPNGQLVMAYAFLKGLGMDGNVGEIAIDCKSSKATATEGHQVASSTTDNGTQTVAIESTRWPFCFEGDAKSPSGTRSILAFLPFNEELNRLTLKVADLPGKRAKVTWGDTTKEFTADELAAGVNLAAEFHKTPFDASFQSFMGAVGNKQNFETYMIKSVITQFRSYPAELKADAELQAALKTVGARLHARQQALDAEVRKLLVPVKHTIQVTAIP